ncbi:MAG TPA: hydrogenase nickel incorporation protein HypB [Tepidisphaeraceae bacterium]|nr:hydrogenase nickel incorporation protein HypB [Tepidisphaeraceae bacterium]
MSQANPSPSVDPKDITRLNRATLQQAGVLTVSMVGGPGCGKTTLINAMVDRLSPSVRVGVIACDLCSHRDAGRIAKHSNQIVQVNIGEGGRLEPEHITDALTQFNLHQVDLLIIENVGTLNLRTPPQLGQDLTITVFSVAAGDDKAEKHPELVKHADLIVLSKTDLLNAVPFNVNDFRRDVTLLNPKVQVIEVSALRGIGLEQLIKWLVPIGKDGSANLSHWFG